MNSKSAIALTTALSTFLLAAPIASHAESQDEWLLRQLRITDGYAPSDSVQGEQYAVATKPAGARPAVIGDRTQSEWFTRQLQISDGYGPVNYVPGETRAVASESDVIADRAQSEWLTRQLQISDGYGPVDYAPGETRVVASEPGGARSKISASF